MSRISIRHDIDRTLKTEENDRQVKIHSPPLTDRESGQAGKRCGLQFGHVVLRGDERCHARHRHVLACFQRCGNKLIGQLSCRCKKSECSQEQQLQGEEKQKEESASGEMYALSNFFRTGTLRTSVPF